MSSLPHRPVSRRTVLGLLGVPLVYTIAGCGSGSKSSSSSTPGTSRNSYRLAYSFDGRGAVSVVLAGNAAYVRRETTITRYDNYGEGKASVLITDRNLGRVNFGSGDASSFAVAPNGYVYVTSDSQPDSSLPPADLVQVYDPAQGGVNIFSFGTSAKKPDNSYDSLSHIVVDKSGFLYALIGNNGFNVQVAKFDPLGKVLAVADKRDLMTESYVAADGTPRTYNTAPNLSADANGNVYLGGATLSPDLVTQNVAIDKTGRRFVFAAPDTAGNLYTFGGAYSSITKYQSDGTQLAAIQNKTEFNNSVVVDAEGRVYTVTNLGVQVYEPY